MVFKAAYQGFSLRTQRSKTVVTFQKYTMASKKNKRASHIAGLGVMEQLSYLERALRDLHARQWPVFRIRIEL